VEARDRVLAQGVAQRLEALGVVPRTALPPPEVPLPDLPPSPAPPGPADALDLGWLHQTDPTPTALALQEGDLPLAFLDFTQALDTVWREAQEGEERHDATQQVQRMQSLEELFDLFRAGVARQVRADDYATHFDLGVGYREMGLLEPALEAFQVAMGDPERTLACCSMLALIEQDRGHLGAATAWLRRGVEAPGFPPEDALGLRYDLANLLLLQGEPGAAHRELEAIGAVDPAYRDVAARLA
jgi:tetratricopeptide (TPR) repeat protein